MGCDMGEGWDGKKDMRVSWCREKFLGKPLGDGAEGEIWVSIK